MTVRPLPSGFVTFMFTDVEGSTRLHRRLGADYADLIAKHDELLDRVIAAHRGAVVRSMGDGVFAAFGDADDAIAAAAVIEESVASSRWPQDARLRLRVGLHAGPAVPRGGDYVALAVHQAARVAAAAHGGQVLLTGEVYERATAQRGSILALGEFHLKDFDEPIALYEFAPDGTPGLRPGARPATAHNVPMLRTSFVGRQREIADIESLLVRDHAPLVTLTGMGGVGKTRLAFEIVLRQAGRFAGGGWTVLLANCVDDGVLPKLMQALGVRDEADVEPIEAIVQALEQREVLLLLDNCEHVLDTVAAVVSAILDRCPSVQLLATSREPLSLPGEIEWRLPPLSMTTAYDGIADAVALFLDRADVRGGALRTHRDIDAIEDICRAVDGIPLAIEIAAARARSLPLAAVATGVRELQFFVSPLRGGEERQRSIHEVVEWSYQLLSAPARTALRRLSVFRGPFDDRDAAYLLDGSESTNDLLAELVDKSLLVLEANSDLPFRMLVIIRRFAFEALTVAGDLETATQRHLDWTLERSDELVARYLGADPEEADAEIVTLFDNFLTAFDHALRAGRASDAAHLAVTLSEYLTLQGRIEIADRWFGALGQVELPAADRARVVMFAGVFSYFRGIHNLAGDAAIRDLDQALELAERLSDDELIGRVCAELGAVHWAAEHTGQAESYFQRALELGSTYTRVRTLNGLGGVRAVQDEHEEALGYFRESVRLAREAGFVTREIIGRFNTAHSLSALGRHEEARGALIACLEPARRTVRALVPGICESLAECALATGDKAAAVSWLREGSGIAQSMGNVPATNAMLERLAALSTSS